MKYYLMEFLNTLSQYPGGDCSVHRGKCRIFKNFLRWELGGEFSTRKTKKLTRDNIKIQRGELINILLWLKTIYTDGPKITRMDKLPSKLNFMKYCIKVENITQFTDHQMNSTVLNQIYPKKSECFLSDMVTRNDSLTVTKTHINMRNGQICKIINISRCLVLLYIIGD